MLAIPSILYCMQSFQHMAKQAYHRIADTQNKLKMKRYLKTGNKEKIKEVAKIIGIDADISGNTPLTWAILEGYPLETIKTLVEIGAQVKKDNKAGNTPLMAAISAAFRNFFNNNRDDLKYFRTIVSYLVKKGATIAPELIKHVEQEEKVFLSRQRAKYFNMFETPLLIEELVEQGFGDPRYQEALKKNLAVKKQFEAPESKKELNSLIQSIKKKLEKKEAKMKTLSKKIKRFLYEKQLEIQDIHEKNQYIKKYILDSFPQKKLPAVFWGF